MNKPRNSDKSQERIRNEAQLAELYEEYYARISRYAFVHIGEKNDAEDIAGETFLRALKTLDSYQERGVPINAWLFKIAHNLVVDYLRKKTKVKMQSMDITPVADNEDPSMLVEKNIQIEKIKGAMQNLTADQRTVIGLRFLGGMTSKEVATIMNKNDGAVREMQRAAIERLRNILAAEAR
jgi:RNA polymerase sigma-70 factor (ECF subfamily)